MQYLWFIVAIGEAGSTLSGGQKARVDLARAVYQDKPIYLFDDIMSAVDRNVAKHIYENCIMKLLHSKTRILCTHQTQYLVNADHIIVMEDGAIIEQGTLSIIYVFKYCDGGRIWNEVVVRISLRVRMYFTLGKPNEVLQDFEDFFLTQETDNSLSADPKFLESITTQLSTKEDTGSVLNEETHETGSVQTEVYFSYWKAVGHLLGISILLCMFLMQASRNITDWWLSFWVSNSVPNNSTNNTHNVTSNYVLYLNQNNSEGDLNYYMMVYGILVGTNTIFTLFRAFLFAYGGICAATSVHKLLLKSVMKVSDFLLLNNKTITLNILQAKITFFDISPLGRILNRFSSDTYTIDDSLPFIMNILFAQVFGTIGAVIITIYGLPWLCLILVPLIPVYHWMQYNYRLTSRELKRLCSVTLSPVYSHFNETLHGLFFVDCNVVNAIKYIFL